jgi:hypothetical protein
VEAHLVMGSVSGGGEVHGQMQREERGDHRRAGPAWLLDLAAQLVQLAQRSRLHASSPSGPSSSAPIN